MVQDTSSSPMTFRRPYAYAMEAPEEQFGPIGGERATTITQEEPSQNIPDPDTLPEQPLSPVSLEFDRAEQVFDFAQRIDRTEQRIESVEQRIDLAEQRIDVLEERDDPAEAIDLTEQRLNLDEQRLNLAEERTMLAEKRLDLAERTKQPTGFAVRIRLAEQRLAYAGERVDLVEERIDLAEERIGLVEDRTELVGDLTSPLTPVDRAERIDLPAQIREIHVGTLSRRQPRSMLLAWVKNSLDRFPDPYAEIPGLVAWIKKTLGRLPDPYAWVKRSFERTTAYPSEAEFWDYIIVANSLLLVALLNVGIWCAILYCFLTWFGVY